MFKRIKEGFKNLVAAINRFFSGVSSAIFGTPAPEQQPLLAEVEIEVAVAVPASQQISANPITPAVVAVKAPSWSPFNVFPRDIRRLMATHLPDSALDNITRTNPATRSLFREMLTERAAARFLFHVVRGNKAAAKKIMDANPSVLLIRTSAIDCAGNEIVATGYEAALSAGDDDMAAMIAEGFTKLENGEAERLKQYQYYQPHFEKMDAMLKAYNPDSLEPTLGCDFDFQSLLKIFMESPAADVTAALNLNFAHESALGHALQAMRIHFSPRKIAAGEMHFNYANLLEAFKVYAREFDNLRVGGNDPGKCDLFWRQVIGYIQRGLPACDRQAYAQSLYAITQEKKPLQRSFEFTYGEGYFPITAGLSGLVCSGLGYEFAVARDGEKGCFARLTRAPVGRIIFSTYVGQKLQACWPMPPLQREQASRCVIC